MPQPTSSPPPAPHSLSSPDLKTSGARLDIERTEQLDALRQALGSALSVIAILGRDLDEDSEWGSAAFL
ncbi:MAG TPA: hypothetical protein VJN70_13880, partial [Gemmatimonadaceae bacterium]|nr:hypothetical protein [Gemmatimonadaceae bacterium]